MFVVNRWTRKWADHCWNTLFYMVSLLPLMFFLSFTPSPLPPALLADVSGLWLSLRLPPLLPLAVHRHMLPPTATAQRGTLLTPWDTLLPRLLPQGTVPGCPLPRVRGLPEPALWCPPAFSSRNDSAEQSPALVVLHWERVRDRRRV